MFHSCDVSVLRAAEPQRICIVKPSALGDVVQSLPVLGPLRARWPEAEITWVIRENLSDLVDRHPLIDDWLTYQRGAGPRAYASLLRQLRERQFDLVIDLQGLLRTAVMTMATRAGLRVGLQTSRDGSFLSHNLILPNTGWARPAYARYWQLANVLEYGDMPVSARLPVTQTATDRAQGWLDKLPRPIVAVHPGATWSTKRWPVGRFAAVASRAVDQWGASVVVVGGNGEVLLSQTFVESLSAVRPTAVVRDLTGLTTIGELTALLGRVDLLLTNDSGPLHLASAVSTKVVGTFTSTSPVISGPPIKPTSGELVVTSATCAGCYRKRCPQLGDRHHACHGDLSIETVWSALQRSMPPRIARTPDAAAVESLAIHSADGHHAG